MTPSLPAIAALVRSGAVERGWELFEAAGHTARSADPAALALKGRLLKARARAAALAERAGLFAAAAEAYGAAHALSPAPYLAINAASLRLLAGDPEGAEAGARDVLALLDGPEPPADTPYFLAATRAEALLLTGDRAGAERAMAAAAACDPDGWDDRASTLTQLREVLTAQGRDAGWLDRFAPPASLHFAGHMGLASGGAGEADLTARVDAFLAEIPVGFAWGALAAGCDIVMAECLLGRGAELHVVLPCPPESFAAQSVAPAGAAWLARYRAVLARAASLRWAGESPASVHDPLATALAGELAIGGAVLNAARLGTAAQQLIACDEDGGGANTARQATLWRAELGPQHRLTTARDAAVDALFPPEQPDPARQLALHAAIGIEQLMDGTDRHSAEIAALAAPVAAGLATLPAASIRARPGLWEFAAPDADAGLAAIQAVLDACRAAGTPLPAIGLHLALGVILADPASGTRVAHGPGPALARRLMDYAPSGLALASDDLAVTLAARAPGPLRSELYLPEEPELGGAAHLLLPRGQ